MAVFQTFFLGPGLGVCEQACAASFAAHGHSLLLYSYDALDVPAGVELADAAAIIPLAERDAFFAVAPDRVSQFSNGFRYRLLNQRGGWWVDTDVMCLSAETPEDEIVLGREHDDWVGTAIMRFPPGHALLQEAARIWRESWDVDTWAFTGPRLMSRLVDDFKLGPVLSLQQNLYPVGWPRALELFDPACRDDVAHSIAGQPFLHIWLSMLPRFGLPRETVPPSGSALRELIDRYLPAKECLDERFVNDVLAALTQFKQSAEKSGREAEHARKVSELAIADVGLERAHGQRLTLQLEDAQARAQMLSLQLEDARAGAQNLLQQLMEAREGQERLRAVNETMAAQARERDMRPAPSLPLRIGRKLGLGGLKRFVGGKSQGSSPADP